MLTGRRGGTTQLGIRTLSELPGGFILIGGLAVLCRVGVPHRTTVDLDTLARGLNTFDDELSRVATSASGGGQYVMPGDIDLDVIDVSPNSATELSEQIDTGGAVTDLEFNVIAHTWAHDNATPMTITVLDDDGALLESAPARLVATSAGLIAMKATTVPLRASSRSEKRASDLYDIARLSFLVTPKSLEGMPPVLGAEVADRLEGWFVDPRGRDRTYREIRRVSEVRVDLDTVAEVMGDLNERLRMR